MTKPSPRKRKAESRVTREQIMSVLRTLEARQAARLNVIDRHQVEDRARQRDIEGEAKWVKSTLHNISNMLSNISERLEVTAERLECTDSEVRSIARDIKQCLECSIRLRKDSPDGTA